MYWRVVQDEWQQRYSLDRVVLKYKLAVVCGDWSSRFLNFLSHSEYIDFEHWRSGRIGSFSLQFRVVCGDESYWIGVGLNGAHGVSNQVRIEFNPNKVGNHVCCRSVLYVLDQLKSRPPEILRWDLAVDVPIRRDNAFLIKDRRMYEERSYSAWDRTQYLGARSKVGRCKLYNKALELDLSYPLTRLEVTLGNDERLFVSASRYFPIVYIIDDLQLCFEGVHIDGPDRIILQHLYEYPSDVVLFNRRIKAKYQRIMQDYFRVLSIDPCCFGAVLEWLRDIESGLPFNCIADPFTGELKLLEEME